MINCPNCNSSYNEDFKFCPFCGEKKPDSNICPNCLSEYYLDYSFCPECGGELLSKNEYLIREEKKAINKIEENRRSWRINRLKRSKNYDAEESKKLINREIDNIELKIDRDLEEEIINKNKQLSLELDEIDKLSFLKELPSLENILNAICLNPGSNPSIFIREAKEEEILEIAISDGELFLINKVDFNIILDDFYFYYYMDVDRGQYNEETDEYEYEFIEFDHDLDPITGNCILSIFTEIDEIERELSEFYQIWKEKEEKSKLESERHEKLRKILDNYNLDNELWVKIHWSITSNEITDEIVLKNTIKEEKRREVLRKIVDKTNLPSPSIYNLNLKIDHNTIMTEEELKEAIEKEKRYYI